METRDIPTPPCPPPLSHRTMPPPPAAPPGPGNNVLARAPPLQRALLHQCLCPAHRALVAYQRRPPHPRRRPQQLCGGGERTAGWC
jgi:hypothetical protein